MNVNVKRKLFHFCLLGAVSFSALTGGAQPVITNQPANQTAILGGSATFSVMATGVGPFTYQWQLNGTNLPNNIVSTIAGGSLFNGIAATNATLDSPNGVAVDSAGNLYIADTFNNVIRKVGTNGINIIVAGTGVAGFSGDGGAATNAQLYWPQAVILDSGGNLLVADFQNNRIRKVNTNGIISTIAGNGSIPVSVSNEGNGGQATNGLMYLPTGLALDASGNLYIADSGDNQIRKVNTSGIISCIANNSGIQGFTADNSPATSAGLYNPEGVVADASGNIYIADTFNHRIRKITASTGNISTVAGNGTAGYSGDGGSATSAKINAPSGVAFDNKENLLVVDSGNHCVRKITNSIISTIAGVGTAGFSGDGAAGTNASLTSPGNVASDTTGNIFIADSGNDRIRKLATNGIISTVAGNILNDGVPATYATLNYPHGVTHDALGNIYVADTQNFRIRRLDTNGIITTFAGSGNYGYFGDGGAATNAGLSFPYGLCMDANGNLFIADYGNHHVRKVDTNGIITTVAGNGLFFSSGDGGAATNAGMLPQAVTVDNAGNLYIADFSARIRKVATNGIITTFAGSGSFGHSGDGGPATNASLAYPEAICFDVANNLFIGEYGAIRKIDTNGIITTVAGKGYQNTSYSGDGGAATNAFLSAPIYGLCIDAAQNLYISDTSNKRIRKVDKNGIITSIAGNGVSGFAGENVSATLASVSLPWGICPDASGNLLFVETGDNRIRKMSYVEYADQPGFTVTNVTLASLSNNYSVIITSASGSVTSSVVTVNLQLPPITPVFDASNGIYNFSWSAISNLTYQLQYTTNLVAPAWTNLGSPVTATSNSVSVTDGSVTDSQRFYRVVLVQ